MLWLDPYERRARLAPGLLALVAIAVAVTALGLRKIPTVSILISLLSAAGGPLLLADFVRKVGLAAQSQLWAAWGGPPTTTLLRLREQSGNPLQRDIWRRAIQAVTGVHLESGRVEERSPAKADNAIEAAVAQLRAATRPDEFKLVAAENKSYGFQRNLYGLRSFGRIVAGLCSATLVGVLLWQLTTSGHVVQVAAVVAGLLLDLLLLLLWVFIPSSSQVHQAAGKYAEELLQAAVTLESSSAGGSASPDGGSSSA